jgi:hypothetical protein
MEKILNKTFTGIERIIVVEENEKYELLDSIVFRNEATNQVFQIITNQEGLRVFEIDEEYFIDGEYEPDRIEEKIIVDEVLTINDIKYFKDVLDTYIIGFVIYTQKGKYHFMRFVDEINYVSEIQFKESLNNVDYIES